MPVLVLQEKKSKFIRINKSLMFPTAIKIVCRKNVTFACSEEKKSSARTMAHYTVQLLRDDTNCPINAEIRTGKIRFKNFFFL